MYWSACRDCRGGLRRREPGVYTLSATQSCLKKAGYGAAVVTDRYLPATQGDLRVRLANPQDELLQPQMPRAGIPPHTYVYLLFEKDPAAALVTEDNAVTLTLRSLKADGFSMSRKAAADGVGLTENVFYYSPTGALTRSERAKVTACMR